MTKYIIFILILFISTSASCNEKLNIKVMTYNVLADPTDKIKRIPLLLKTIIDSHADVIALQEVTPWFIQELNKSKLFTSYSTCTIDGIPINPSGLYIMSKGKLSNIKFGKLKGKQNRSYLLATTSINNVQFTVATCHLESYLWAGHIRANQLDTIFSFIKDAPNCIFLGDFNFGFGEKPDTSHINKNFKDVWPILNNKKPGFTWNIEKSPMAKKGSFKGEASRRLDRIFFKSKRLEPTSCVIIGNKPVSKSGEIFPSDHFGLVANFSIK